jgi:BirA family transcriptional regulator, biotin operon repressor / biotin---[acetyl-CoA-carboxylase] ligase
VISWNLTIKDTLNSTNDYLKELGKKGAPEGTAVMAHWQIAGRGRLGRVWISSHGLGLYLSWLIRPPRDFDNYELLGVLSGVPVAQVLREQVNLDVRLKWSNDLMVGERKLGGILGETVIYAQERFMVLGLGINLRQQKYDFPLDLQDKVTSLAMEGANDCQQEELAAVVLNAFTPLYSDMIAGRLQKWLDAYRVLSCTIGTRQQCDAGEGMAVGLGARGELLVRHIDGKIVAWEL